MQFVFLNERVGLHLKTLMNRNYSRYALPVATCTAQALHVSYHDNTRTHGADVNGYSTAVEQI